MYAQTRSAGELDQADVDAFASDGQLRIHAPILFAVQMRRADVTSTELQHKREYTEVDSQPSERLTTLFHAASRQDSSLALVPTCRRG